ncbi:MAG: class I SAM-dependent methyltransferase [Erysipelotrichaceae bacterium]|nr:class I SAM-dependent methyltransferase [Erysipelotrichaceae bacterium]
MVRQLLEEIRKEALTASVPIMDEDSLLYVSEFVSNHGISRILEIGTATGYSSITIASGNPQAVITTLEIDQQRHQQAVENIRRTALQDRITAVCTDARSYEAEGMYDLILLDGPKAHNSELVRRYESHLKEDGYFVIDDVYFHGFIEKPHVIYSRRLRVLVKRFTAFQQEMEASEDYECTRLNIGDGLLIARKRRKSI